MFDLLSEKLKNTFAKLRSTGKVTEADLDNVLKEIRLTLLEADVNFKIVKDFISKIRERSMGVEVLKSLTPGQQIIKIVHEELIELLGGSASKLTFSANPTVILLAGLQGSGKTTTAAKLALWARKNNQKNPFLIAADTQRPAAVDQLKTLGNETDIPVYSDDVSKGAVVIAEAGIKEGRAKGHDVIIVDTAGRLHIDEELMEELQKVKQVTRPHNVLLVVDSMTGQDAIQLANSFNQNIGIDGIILTKLDGDARGGAALSAKSVTGKPIRFASFGEKMSSFDVFHPDRMASRILGMGDVLTLIERAQDNIEKENTDEMQKKLMKGKFDLQDFLNQMKQLKKMGPLSSILKMLPGVPGGDALKNLKIDDNQMKRTEAIITSMTMAERQSPEILNGSRKLRIAQGSGTGVHDVNNLLKSFEQSKKMIKKLTSGGFTGKLGKGLPF